MSNATFSLPGSPSPTPCALGYLPLRFSQYFPGLPSCAHWRCITAQEALSPDNSPRSPSPGFKCSGWGYPGLNQSLLSRTPVSMIDSGNGHMTQAGPITDSLRPTARTTGTACCCLYLKLRVRRWDPLQPVHHHWGKKEGHAEPRD